MNKGLSIKAHLHSYRIAKLEILAQNTNALLGEATGFFCEYGGSLFLVTNWHVVAGRHYQTRSPLHHSQALPGTLKVHTHLAKSVAPIAAPSASTSFLLPLLNESAEPCWLEHPLFACSVDVVAIPIDFRIVDHQRFYRIDLETELSRNVQLSVMDQTFVTGYPLSATTTPNSLPIYKSGTIASEPAIFDSEPRVYIDSKTKQGMSGSPVMVKPHNEAHRSDALAFVGIYSGRDRQERSEFEAELAIMWPFRECLIPILTEYLEEDREFRKARA